MWSRSDLDPAYPGNVLQTLGGDSIRRGQQSGFYTTEVYNTGTINSVSADGRFIYTNLTANNCFAGRGLDSGTPWFLPAYGDTLLGVGTSMWGSPPCLVGIGGRYDVVANWRPAILALNSWVVSNYGNTKGGAYFCAWATCS
jgi:hypothetical protein